MPLFLECQHIAYSRNGHSYEHFNFPNPVWFKLSSLCLEVQLKARCRMEIRPRFNQFLFTGVDHSGNTYQECAEKVECTEINYGGYGAATRLGFVRIAFCIVKTMQHYPMPILASGCPMEKKIQECIG